MRKTFTIFCLLLFVWIKVFAQPAASPLAKDVLKSMPDEVIPILTHNNILDMIDFLNASCKAEVTNRMNGKSEMTVLTDHYAYIQVTPSNTTEIKLLPLQSGGTLIYLVSTCTTDSLSDSSVKVYTDKWELADERQQFRFPHPDSYNTLKLSATDNNADLTVTEDKGFRNVLIKTKGKVPRGGYSSVELTYRLSDGVMIKMILEEAVGSINTYEIK